MDSNGSERMAEPKKEEKSGRFIFIYRFKCLYGFASEPHHYIHVSRKLIDVMCVVLQLSLSIGCVCAEWRVQPTQRQSGNVWANIERERFYFTWISFRSHTDIRWPTQTHSWRYNNNKIKNWKSFPCNNFWVWFPYMGFPSAAGPLHSVNAFAALDIYSSY